MALIKCPECGKEISDKAKACPKCGWKVNVDEIKKEMKQEEVKKEDVLPKKSIEIEVSCFEPDAYKSVLNNEIKIQEQVKESQGTRTDLTSSPNGEKVKSIHTDKELVKMAGVGNVAENDTIMKSDSVEADETKKEKKCNKKGKIFKKIIIAVVVLIALGVWSVVLVKMTANMIVENLDISIESIEVVESDKVVIPKQTNVAAVETSKPTESADNNISKSEDEEVLDEEVEDTNDDQTENIHDGIEVSLSHVSYGDVYFFVKNNTDEDIIIDFGSTYVNDINIRRYYQNYLGTVSPGKTNQCELCFPQDSLKSAAGNMINKIEVEIYINDENKVGEPKRFVLDNLGINY